MPAQGSYHHHYLYPVPLSTSQPSPQRPAPAALDPLLLLFAPLVSSTSVAASSQLSLSASPCGRLRRSASLPVMATMMPVTLDTPIVIKIVFRGQTKKFKLPLKDLGAHVLPDKVPPSPTAASDDEAQPDGAPQSSRQLCEPDVLTCHLLPASSLAPGALGPGNHL